MSTQPKFKKNGRTDSVPKRPKFKSCDGGNIPVPVLRRKFPATAIPRLFSIGDGDNDSYRTA